MSDRDRPPVSPEPPPVVVVGARKQPILSDLCFWFLRVRLACRHRRHGLHVPRRQRTRSSRSSTSRWAASRTHVPGLSRTRSTSASTRWGRTLGFRIGNDRDNPIVEVTVRVCLTRTEKTGEGVKFYRMVDLPLVRERAPVLSRSWTAMHPITPSSPLFGVDAAAFQRMEGELLVTISGTDDTSLQLVHARHTYAHEHILWGFRHADVLSERADGAPVLDVSKFHDVVEAPLVVTTDK